MLRGDNGMYSITLMAIYIIREESVHSNNKWNTTYETQSLHEEERAFQNHGDFYRVIQQNWFVPQCSLPRKLG